ncbi:hypothetical protein TNCV_2992831 [Trichonephila clavipes]|nr:hypothetical protein TNCV_2992831 [Trichonephila clavipes]
MFAILHHTKDWIFWHGTKCGGYHSKESKYLLLLQSVPASIKARMWFQHDGVLAHFSAGEQSALGSAYPGIERGGPVNWPASSLDLSCLDFFL